MKNISLYIIAIFTLLVVVPTWGNDYCHVKYTVGQPMTDVEIIYDADMWWNGDNGDYFIEYKNSNDTAKSFVASIGDSYYRYDGRKLSEYHRDNDSIPFIGKTPVTKSGIFYQFLPRVLQKEINELIMCKDNKVNKAGNGVLYITQLVGGHEAKSIKYNANSDDMPNLYDALNNPGQMGEQSVIVEYTYPEGENIGEISEQMLVSRYTDVFAKYRSSNYSLSSLKGSLLPALSVSDLSGNSAEISSTNANNSLVVYMENGAGLNDYTISQIREGVEQSIIPVKIFWIYTGKNIEAINEEIGQMSDDEKLLVGGKRTATKLGITGYPVVFFINKSGIVSGISIGTNNDFKSIVIQGIESMNK